MTAFRLPPKDGGRLFGAIFLIVVLLWRVQSQSYPEISFISKEKVVNIGDSVSIMCVVQFARDYPVEFVKVNKKDPRNYLFISKGAHFFCLKYFIIEINHYN